MKKNVVILLAFLLLVSVLTVSHAGHESMVIPYESVIFGEKTMMPMPSGGDVRNHIIGHMPYKKWKTWPGKGKMYKGTEPHGALLITYVNEAALESINAMRGMKNNAIIVKENYSPERKLMAVTVMYKVKGYNADGGDWFWAKYNSDYEIEAEGKPKACLDCHGTAKNNDYVFTGDVIKK